ncbi:MAG: hypothetical protein ACRD3S_16035 [Terracidiphilus sp.]
MRDLFEQGQVPPAGFGPQAFNHEEEEDGDESDPDMDGRYRIEIAEVGEADGGSGKQEA